MATCDGSPQILAATSLEAWAVRLRLPGVPVVRTGVALRRRPRADGAVAVMCGLAGALAPDLPPGTVVVPEVVGLADGRRLPCHAGWVAALTSAAQQLGLRTETDPLLTAATLVTGNARAYWAGQGYVAADMETGLLAGNGWQVATVRVILDTPARSIAEEWERPMRAVLQPRLWGELIWLAHSAPRYSLRAARVVGLALTAAQRGQ